MRKERIVQLSISATCVGRNEKLTPPIASPTNVTEVLCAEMAVIFSCRGGRR